MRRLLALFACLIAIAAPARANAIDFVQGNAGVPQTDESAVTVVYPDAQTAGNLNLVVIGWNDAVAQVASVTDTLGNVYVRAVGPTIHDGVSTQSIYYAVNGTSASAGGNAVTVTLTAPARFVDVRIAEYRGVDSLDPVDVVASQTGTGQLADSGSVQTTSADVLLVGANVVQTRTLAPATGDTVRLLTEPDGDVLQDRAVSGAGAYNAAATLEGWDHWIMQVVALRSASNPPRIAVVTYPAAGALNADLSRPIQWTTIAGAQAYVLWVGTTPGAKDLVVTPEIQQTSYAAGNLPPNRTLYARVWTKVASIWRYSDSTFSAAPILATITYPANGAVNADLSKPIQWMSIANAQAYVLWLGSTAGAKDVLSTAEIQQTFYQATNLPAGKILYARVWTKVGGVWRSSDSIFSVASNVAELTFPSKGAVNADLSQPIKWTDILNAQAYVLYLGTTAGAKDVLNTNEIAQTWYRVWALPSGQTIYARIWTKVAGVWRWSDSTFTAAPMTYSISGTITPVAVGAGATLTLSGTVARTTTADQAGTYAFSGLPNGVYTVTPSSGTQRFSPASWTATISGMDIASVSFTTDAPTKDRANSYDNDWKAAWVAHARSVLAGAAKTDGFVLQIGDSITHSRSYGLWPVQGAGKTAEDRDVLTWAGAATWGNGNTDIASRNGWYLTGADVTAQRSFTSASGISLRELVSGCCNGGPQMPASSDPTLARQLLLDPSYSGNLQLDTAIAPFADAQFAVVMLGTNDAGNPAAAADLAAVIDTLERLHIVPMLSTIPPRADPIANLLAMQMNRTIVSVARSRSLPLIDFYQEIVLRRPGTSWMNTLIADDGVHPTASRPGYASDSDPYLPGGNPALHTSGDALLNVGYLLRSWLTVQKLKEVKRYVVDGVEPPN